MTVCGGTDEKNHKQYKKKEVQLCLEADRKQLFKKTRAPLKYSKNDFIRVDLNLKDLKFHRNYGFGTFSKKS